MKKYEQRLRDLWDDIKNINKCIIRIPEEEERRLEEKKKSDNQQMTSHQIQQRPEGGRKEKRSQINNLSLHLKKQEK